MTLPTHGFLALLLVATLRLSLAVLLGMVVLRLVRIRMPALHRWTWSIVLLQGLVLSPILVSLPILAPQPTTLDTKRLTNVTAIGNSTPSMAFDGNVRSRSPVRQAIMAKHVVLFVWFAGCAITLLVLAASQCAVHRILRSSCPARTAWKQQLARLVRQSGVRRPVYLRVHPTLGPFLARSLGGYTILVPRQTWEGLNAEQREAVLLHELSHLQRGDVWTSLLMRCMASIHWFNPMAWWAVARFDEAAEWACDAHVRRQGERPAAALAAALLQLARPNRLVRIGVSTAKGARIGVRIRKLVDPLEKKETAMKKIFIVGFAAALLLIAFVRLQLTAQEMTGVSGSAGLQAKDIAQLVEDLQDSSDPLARDIHAALVTEAGKLVLQDRLSERASRSGRELRRDIVNIVLGEHFSIEGDRAHLIDSADPIRAELLRAGATSVKDMQALTDACRRIAEELVGDDETTLLVKRFLTQETGLGFLYVSVLREQMQPGPAMFADSLGRVLAMDSDGKYYLRPDAREKLSAIVGTREAAETLASRLRRSLKTWSDDLAPGVELHKQIQANASNALFAASLVADQVFDRRRIDAGAADEVLDHLDQMVVETSKGLQIAKHARDEISRVMEEFEQVKTRIEAVRPALDILRSKIADADELSSQFKELLGTDIGLMAVAKGSEMAAATTDQLVRSILNEALEESSGQLRLTSDPDTREKINGHLQDGLREFRSARRRAAPVRELANLLEDPELSRALKSLGGMLVVKQLAEEKIADVERAVLSQWKDETFEETQGSLSTRGSARKSVQRFLEEVKRMNKGLSENDF